MDSADEQPASERQGELAATISREMVRLMRKTAGRGPTKARTMIGRDEVVVVFQETLTHGERVLVDNDMHEEVLAVRQGYQAVLSDEATAMIEQVLSRKVIGFMSTNHFDPDLAAEIFILDPTDGNGGAEPAEAEHEGDGH